MNIKKFQISETKSLNEALLSIEKNKRGFILAIDKSSVVKGVLTDGDIRRALINGNKLTDPLKVFVNKNFIYGSQDTSREFLLKKLDSKIKFIPILNTQKKLIYILTPEDVPLKQEDKVIVRSKSPVRISFAGGGSDVTSFFEKYEGATLNATISLYAHVSLILREDKKIIIKSLDLNKELKADNLQTFLKSKNEFGLIQSVIKMIDPNFGFELYIYSDFIMKSGLGGSSAVISAILGCFNEYRIDQWNSNEIAELAFQAERLYFKISGGWQDQYATVFGGLNFIQFRKDKNTVYPLRLSNTLSLEFQETLILFDTNISRDSGQIHLDQKQEMEKSKIYEKVKDNVKLAFKMRDALLHGQFEDFGAMMHKTWENKKKLSSKISSKYFDKIYDLAVSNGAMGGKLLGAGGGGFFLFCVKPFMRAKLISALNEIGLKKIPFIFEDKGLQSWKIRK